MTLDPYPTEVSLLNLQLPYCDSHMIQSKCGSCPRLVVCGPTVSRGATCCGAGTHQAVPFPAVHRAVGLEHPGGSCVTCRGDPRCLPPGGFQSISPHVSQGAAQQFCPRICMPASPQGYAGMADRGFSQCQYMRNIPLAMAKCTASHTESVAAGLFTHLVLFSPFLAHKMLLF